MRPARALAAGRFAVALPAAARKRGRYTVTVTATDVAGNAASAQVRFRVGG
jgi:hypothetical protein